MTSALKRSILGTDSGLENRGSGDRTWRSVLLIVVYCVLLSGCSSRAQSGDGNAIEFTRVPLVDKGGSPRLDIIQGRVNGASPGQKIVLFARSGAWYVQPFANQQFTTIQPDATWTNSTHLGTEYAALLVEPDYSPPAATFELPGKGAGVVALAIVPGTPQFWQTWWFQVLCILTGAAAILGLYRLRLRQLTRQMNVRFEERLLERTRIAQDLHDTLLQGFLSASMQLHMAADQLPADSPAKPTVSRVLELMGQVIDEGRKALLDLRSPSHGVHDLEQAFSRIQQELMLPEPINFRVVVEGKSRALHPIIRDEVYRIGREAVVNAFRHSGANNVEVDLEYSSKQLRILVRDNGCGIDPQVLRSGRDGHWGLSGMRERAGEIGAQFKVWSRVGGGTEVELSVPARTAFETDSSNGKREWLTRLVPGRTVGGGSGKEPNK